MVALESTALSLAKTIVQKAASAWIADRRTAEERKKELRALLTPRFGHAAAEQRFLDEAASDLTSPSHEFRGLDDGNPGRRPPPGLARRAARSTTRP